MVPWTTGRAILLIAVSGLAGCASTPPPSATDITRVVTATLERNGPPRWTYVVSTAGTSRIVRADLPAPQGATCTIEQPPAGWTVLAPTGSVVTAGVIPLAKIAFDLVCEAGVTGPSRLTVVDEAGMTFFIGPIDGPING